ncbi:MAG: hypothetical protein OEV49_03670 [candidate division Zixibacteria bacterium]|nr:hypothetical protein [candidate division Zixibacteria bacterium]MDH3938985.1 hypothetical protein [candidate division Zixibacteria bacterium]
MSFKPGDFFIGVIDFFSVILPGAILTIYLLYISEYPGPEIIMLKNGDSLNWLTLGLASYFLGHLLFALSSHLDWFYDRYYVRNRPSGKYLLNCAESYKIDDFAKEQRAPLSPAETRETSKNRHKRITNLFKWASVNIAINEPASASEVNRLQADSKFFRSVAGLIILVLLLELTTSCVNCCLDRDLGQLGLFCSLPTISLTVLVLFFCGWRYMELRMKAVELCYRYYIALRKRRGSGSDSSPSG